MSSICVHCEKCIHANYQVIETFEGPLHAPSYEIQIASYDRREA